MAVHLAMADDGLDGGSAPQLLLDLAVNAALLARFEDPERFWRIVAPVALVDIDPFDLAAGQRLGFLDRLPQGVAVVRIAGQGLGVEDELAALATSVGGGERDLDAELVGLVRLALADALGLGGVSGIELPARFGDASGCGFARPWITPRRRPPEVPRRRRSCAGYRE